MDNKNHSNNNDNKRKKFCTYVSHCGAFCFSNLCSSNILFFLLLRSLFLLYWHNMNRQTLAKYSKLNLIYFINLLFVHRFDCIWRGWGLGRMSAHTLYMDAVNIYGNECIIKSCHTTIVNLLSFVFVQTWLIVVKGQNGNVCSHLF